MTPRLRSLLLTVSLSVMVSSAVLGAAVWYRRTAAEPRPSPVAGAASRPPEAQPAAPATLLAPAPGASPLAPTGSAIALQPPYTVLDGLTVRSGRQVVRLADLHGPHRDAVCYDRGGHLWACGLRARAALTNLISGHALDCRVVGREGEAVVAHCRRDQADLGRDLVAAGWARPALDKQAPYNGELGAAMETGAGLWEGGWRIRVSAYGNDASRNASAR